MIFRDQSTIVACCTPQGGTGGSLAVIRVSGPDTFPCVERIARLSSGKTLLQCASHTIHHGQIVNEKGGVIDEVMFLLMRAPRTFTGEDTIEITCHANPLIVQHCIEAIIAQGARLAQRGEFTQQAFLNKKLDLMQAEAIQELITVKTEQGIQASLAQLSGSMSSALASLEQRIMTALSWCEASFEFVEEVGDFGSAIREQIGELIARISDITRAHSAQTHLTEGIRIALVGAVNAGKSSLFNALLGKERAIVTPVAGTTRDSIEASIHRHGQSWTLIDTAGLRDTQDPIEQEGMTRSLRAAQGADLILVMIDQSRPLSAHEQAALTGLLKEHKHKALFIFNKTDLPLASENESLLQIRHLTISSATGAGLTALEELIGERIKLLYTTRQLPFLVNQRHHAILSSVMQELQTVMVLCEATAPSYELISYHLQRTLEILNEVTGKTISEAALDRVFREFCIGK